MHRTLVAALLCLIAACSSDAQTSTIQLRDAFPRFRFSNPVDLQHADDGTNRLFVVEQPGVIRVFANSPSADSARTFLDIRDRVTDGGEMGLLGLAFHPNYEENGFLYVNYTAQSPLRTVISRFTVDPGNPNRAVATSEFVLLEFAQPFQNHNGGQVSFGPDGFLYIAVGDGGSGGDPENHGQNKQSLLGKILRIDVNAGSNGLLYSIPQDNPYAGSSGSERKEIYAYGMRNPWRFSFDPVTGWLWTGDVGQNAYEEIDIIEKGKNYGWRIMEGKHCFNPRNGCDTSGLTLPIWEYGRTLGVSVTGGFVYRGTRVPELVGEYLYADFGSGNIWGLRYDGSAPASNRLLLQSGFSVAAFGVDQNNELYICAFNGRIYTFDVVAGTEEAHAHSSPISLAGNHPNPFSAGTIIRYTLAHASHVQLTVSDVLGRVVATLIDGEQSPGDHIATFDGAEHPPGAYFYTIRDGNGIERQARMVISR
ncbi:MAG: PQQ-dependent sugar dehydrogenase [bacterium]|nr:PQQ-dependent sugar dehydrogenase [Candidatus Kapabacteria bacterium]